MGTNFSEAYTLVLQQHIEVRGQLRELEAYAAGRLSPATSLQWRRSLLRVAALFEQCLGFEEAQLAPQVRAVDAWGPVREDAMLAEHVEQRALLERLRALADERPTAELGREVSCLTARLLECMTREEVGLSSLETLDECGADQMTG